MPKTIDLDMARGLLARAVLTQGPDFVYNPEGHGDCHYEPLPDTEGPKGVTGCLVGVALGLHGAQIPKGSTDSIVAIRNESPDMATEAAAVYFQAAQWAQDNGNSWGQAYATAEKRVADGTLLGSPDVA